MTDIDERLVRFAGKVCISTDTEVEAAAIIKSLRDENARLQRYATERDHYREQWAAATAEIARLRKQLEKYEPTKILGDQRIGVSGTKPIQWPSPAYPYDARAAMGESNE